MLTLFSEDCISVPSFACFNITFLWIIGATEELSTVEESSRRILLLLLILILFLLWNASFELTNYFFSSWVMFYRNTISFILENFFSYNSSLRSKELLTDFFSVSKKRDFLNKSFYKGLVKFSSIYFSPSIRTFS